MTFYIFELPTTSWCCGTALKSRADAVSMNYIGESWSDTQKIILKQRENEQSNAAARSENGALHFQTCEEGFRFPVLNPFPEESSS